MHGKLGLMLLSLSLGIKRLLSLLSSINKIHYQESGKELLNPKLVHQTCSLESLLYRALISQHHS